MKVNELIAILTKAPQDAEVIMYLGLNEEADAPLKDVMLVSMDKRRTAPYYVKGDAYIEFKPFKRRKVVTLADYFDEAAATRKGVEDLGHDTDAGLA